MSNSSFFVVAILVISAVSFAFVVPPVIANTQTQRLGFWLQDHDALNSYSSSTFFNAMFLTPPYPATMEVMIFAVQQAERNNQGCSASSGYISQAETYWGGVAQMANNYPNIRLIFEIAFDASSGGAGTYGLSCFNTLVQYFGQYASVYGLGVEGEYTLPQTTALYSTAGSYVSAAGKQFINYYARVMLPAGSYDIAHTNFPGGDAGGSDQVGTLGIGSPNTVGIDSGYYAYFQFPGTVTCPIGATAMNSLTWGHNQCVVSTELSTAVSMPASARQFVVLDPGFDGTNLGSISTAVYFTGVSGQSTYQLWDNPTLRNWIWTDPNYQGRFLLSTGATAAITTTTTSSSTSGVTTASTTTAYATTTIRTTTSTITYVATTAITTTFTTTSTITITTTSTTTTTMVTNPPATTTSIPSATTTSATTTMAKATGSLANLSVETGAIPPISSFSFAYINLGEYLGYLAGSIFFAMAGYLAWRRREDRRRVSS